MSIKEIIRGIKDEIFDAKPNTSQGDEFELLSLLINHCEQEHYSIDLPHPIEAIKFRMDQIAHTFRGINF